MPVPESYRQKFTVGGCNTLIRKTLIDWNLAFGDERTTTEALRFLEDAYIAGQVPAGEFATSFAHNWQTALTALRKAGVKPGTPGSMDADGRIGRLPGVKRIGAQTDTLDHYALLALQYFRAAEFYGSRDLLARGEAYADAVEGAADAVDRTTTDNATADRLDLSWIVRDEIKEVRMRRAVLTALMLRSPAQLAKARSVMARYKQPGFDELADVDFNRYVDCTTAEDPTIKAACANNNFDAEALAYLGHRAYLELAEIEPGDCDTKNWNSLRFYSAALQLSRQAAIRDGDRPGWQRYYDEHMFSLHIARARLLEASQRLSRCNADWLREQLSEAEQALRAIDIVEQPARFDLAASIFITAFDALPETDRTPNGSGGLRFFVQR